MAEHSKRWDCGAAYALGGALWALISSTLLLVAIATLALGWSVPWPMLGVGRLMVAGLQSGLQGAISLALAGGLLGRSRGLAGEQGVPRAGWLGLGLWHFGLVAALVLNLTGGMSPEPFVPPLPATLCLWAAAASWLLALWGAALRQPGPPAPAAWFGLSASLGLLAAQSVGLLAGVLGGASQAIAGGVYARWLLGLWVVPAGLGMAARWLPRAVGRPLYGRRLAVVVWASWFVIQPLAADRDSTFDLVAGAMARLASAATVLSAVPALLAAVLLTGTLVGAERRRPDGPTAFLLAGVLVAMAGTVFDAALAASAPWAAQFSAWSSGLPWPPLWLGPWLMAIGSSYATVGMLSSSAGRIPPKRHLLLAAIAVLCLAAARWPVGLAEIAGGATAWLGGEGAAAVRFGATLLLPGMALLWTSCLVWGANLLSAQQASEAVSSDRASADWATPSPGVARSAGQTEGGLGWPSAGGWGSPGCGFVAWSTVLVMTLGLLISLFLPLSLPRTVAVSPGAPARDIPSVGARAEGRAVYVAEGCVVCHTQRVRALEADRAYGPALLPGDYGSGPALAGQRRWGPDLAWVGDRYRDRAALEVSLARHGPSGTPSFGWLFDDEVLGPRGQALVDYLAGLESGGPEP